MSTEFSNDLNGVEAANAELDRMIAADAASQKSEDRSQKTEGQKQGEDGAQSAEAAEANAERLKAESGEPKPEDGSQKTGAKPEDEKARDEAGKFKKADEAKGEQGKNGEEKGTGSRYEKAKARLTGGWDELNTGKAQLQTERETWTKQREAEKLALEQERAEFEQQRAQAYGQFNPEQYDTAAAKFEREGKFDLADLAKAKAAELRKNPPQKPADRLAGQRKEWALKAATEFPDVAKDNSPLQLRVAQILKSEPDMERHPKGIYLAARIAQLEAKASESQAAIAKAAEADKALKTAQARIKELEQLSAPGDGQGHNRLPKPKSFAQMTDAEKLRDLERMAVEVGSL